jgi:NAD-dependent dihydropyrimidine dehydrogenase PreA subunit
MQGRFLYNWPDSEASFHPKNENFGRGELAEAVSVDEKKCVGCGQCVLVCDFNALEVRYGLSKVKREDCVICGVCLDFCPMNALGWERT